MTLSTDIPVNQTGTYTYTTAAESSIIDRSPELHDLFAAMAKVQGELEHANKNATNPHFRSRYADLAEVIDTGRKVASKYGISVIQFPEGESNLITILAHASGQYIMSRMTMKPEKNTPQGVGSCITYARRYAYSAVLGIAPDEDDDGNAASNSQPPKTAPTKQPYQRGGSSPLKTFNRD